MDSQREQQKGQLNTSMEESVRPSSAREKLAVAQALDKTLNLASKGDASGKQKRKKDKKAAGKKGERNLIQSCQDKLVGGSLVKQEFLELVNEDLCGFFDENNQVKSKTKSNSSANSAMKNVESLDKLCEISEWKATLMPETVVFRVVKIDIEGRRDRNQRLVPRFVVLADGSIKEWSSSTSNNNKTSEETGRHSHQKQKSLFFLAPISLKESKLKAFARSCIQKWLLKSMQYRYDFKHLHDIPDIIESDSESEWSDDSSNSTQSSEESDSESSDDDSENPEDKSDDEEEVEEQKEDEAERQEKRQEMLGLLGSLKSYRDLKRAATSEEQDRKRDIDEREEEKEESDDESEDGDDEEDQAYVMVKSLPETFISSDISESRFAPFKEKHIIYSFRARIMGVNLEKAVGIRSTIVDTLRTPTLANRNQLCAKEQKVKLCWSWVTPLEGTNNTTDGQSQSLGLSGHVSPSNLKPEGQTGNEKVSEDLVVITKGAASQPSESLFSFKQYFSPESHGKEVMDSSGRLALNAMKKLLLYKCRLKPEAVEKILLSFPAVREENKDHFVGLFLAPENLPALCDALDQIIVTPIDGEDLELSPDDVLVVRGLFPHCCNIKVKKLAGGFSGSIVLQTTSYDIDGKAEESTVLKLDNAKSILEEERRHRMMIDYLGDHAPVVLGRFFATSEEEECGRAGIKISLAGDQSIFRGTSSSQKNHLITLKELYLFEQNQIMFHDNEGQMNAEKNSNNNTDLAAIHSVHSVLLEVFGEVFEKCTVQSSTSLGRKREDLRTLYDVTGAIQKHVFHPLSRKNLMELVWTEDVIQKECGLFDQPEEENSSTTSSSSFSAHAGKVFDVLLKINKWLGSSGEHLVDTYVGMVHGDLNAGNIVVDARGTPWVIDFMHSGVRHVLYDLAKLMSCILLEYLDVESLEQLRCAIRMLDALVRHQKSLQDPLADDLDRTIVLPLLEANKPMTWKKEKLGRMQLAWQNCRMLRDYCAKYTLDAQDIRQLHMGMLYFSIKALSFKDTSKWQKQLALASILLHGAELIGLERRKASIVPELRTMQSKLSKRLFPSDKSQEELQVVASTPCSTLTHALRHEVHLKSYLNRISVKCGHHIDPVSRELFRVTDTVDLNVQTATSNRAKRKYFFKGGTFGVQTNQVATHSSQQQQTSTTVNTASTSSTSRRGLDSSSSLPIEPKSSSLTPASTFSQRSESNKSIKRKIPPPLDISAEASSQVKLESVTAFFTKVKDLTGVELQTSQRIVICGPSSSGKTVLLKKLVSYALEEQTYYTPVYIELQDICKFLRRRVDKLLSVWDHNGKRVTPVDTPGASTRARQMRESYQAYLGSHTDSFARPLSTLSKAAQFFTENSDSLGSRSTAFRGIHHHLHHHHHHQNVSGKRTTNRLQQRDLLRMHNEEVLHSPKQGGENFQPRSKVVKHLSNSNSTGTLPRSRHARLSDVQVRPFPQQQPQQQQKRQLQVQVGSPSSPSNRSFGRRNPKRSPKGSVATTLGRQPDSTRSRRRNLRSQRFKQSSQTRMQQQTTDASLNLGILELYWAYRFGENSPVFEMLLQALQSNRIILFLDGLDEMRSETKGDLLEWLDTEPEHYVFITSRNEKDLRQQMIKFHPVQIKPLTLEHVNKMIQTHVQNVEASESLELITAGAADHLCAFLQDEIRKPMFKEIISGSPLLVSLLLFALTNHWKTNMKRAHGELGAGASDETQHHAGHLHHFHHHHHHQHQHHVQQQQQIQQSQQETDARTASFKRRWSLLNGKSGKIAPIVRRQGSDVVEEEVLEDIEWGVAQILQFAVLHLIQAERRSGSRSLEQCTKRCMSDEGIEFFECMAFAIHMRKQTQLALGTWSVESLQLFENGQEDRMARGLGACNAVTKLLRAGCLSLMSVESSEQSKIWAERSCRFTIHVIQEYLTACYIAKRILRLTAAGDREKLFTFLMELNITNQDRGRRVSGTNELYDEYSDEENDEQHGAETDSDGQGKRRRGRLGSEDDLGEDSEEDAFDFLSSDDDYYSDESSSDDDDESSISSSLSSTINSYTMRPTLGSVRKLKLLSDPWWQSVFYLAMKQMIPQDITGKLCLEVLQALMELTGHVRFPAQLGKFVKYIVRTGDDGLLHTILSTLEKGTAFRSWNVVQQVLNPLNPSKSTPLMQACRRGHTYIASLVLDHVMEEEDMDVIQYINRPTLFGETALTIAAEHGNLECLEVLVENGADVNHQLAPDSANALYLACYEQHLECARFLLSHGANPNASCEGTSCLFNAAVDGSFEICKLLLEYGADRALANPSGHTPLSIARENKRETLLPLFEGQLQLQQH